MLNNNVVNKGHGLKNVTCKQGLTFPSVLVRKKIQTDAVMNSIRKTLRHTYRIAEATDTECIFDFELGSSFSPQPSRGQHIKF